MDEILDSVGDFARPERVDAMRGTIVVTTRPWLRGKQLESAYFDRLPPMTRRLFETIVATDWIPIVDALAHYDALDQLGLARGDREAVGAYVSRAINGLVLNTIGRLAGSLGVAPVVPLRRTAQLFGRSFRGGAIRVVQVAEEEARFEVAGAPIARSEVHRDSIIGALRDGIEPFASSVRITEMVERRTATSYAHRIRWGTQAAEPRRSIPPPR